MPTQTYPATLSTLNIHSERLEKLVEDVESKFPPEPVHPKAQMSSIMYRAGQQNVVQYIKQYLDEN